jgi:Domain of unknown function (DUF4271)
LLFFGKLVQVSLHVIAVYTLYSDIFGFMRLNHRASAVLIALTGILSSFSTDELYVLTDLQNEWMVFEGGAYQPFRPEKDSGTDAIYFWLDANKYQGQYLQVSSKYRKAIFIDGKLIVSGSRGRDTYSIDSLRDQYFSSSLLIGIYTPHIYPENLNTFIASKNRTERAESADMQRPNTYFRDFVVTVILFLLVLLIVVTQLTKISLSFFSGRRLFSIHEGEEAQLYTRIGSTTNILFYVFCSLILGFYLIVVFHFVGDRFLIALEFRSTTFFETVLQWGKLSMFLLIAFFVKIILALVFSRMFGMWELFAFHVVNWMRLLLVVFGMLTLVLVVYFISRGINELIYVAFFWNLVLVLVTWLIILFTKVASRSGFSLFHIFSYLCATEVIPLLISVKLLYH